MLLKTILYEFYDEVESENCHPKNIFKLAEYIYYLKNILGTDDY